jgi:putative Ca2+/H+ antiporter (TMEM165/GDT1 family)
LQLSRESCSLPRLFEEIIVNLTIFLSTFGIIFLAELGDKTQLTAMALATRYPWKKIFLGIAVAFALLNLGAVLVGKLLFTMLPVFWIKLVSGGLFLFFGISTLLTKDYHEDNMEGKENKFFTKGPIVTAFLMILLAELGDKTQIVTASLAAQHDSFVAVFFGSTIALWSVSLVGMFLGLQLTRFIPLPYIHKGAGCLFVAFGIVVIYQAIAGA